MAERDNTRGDFMAELRAAHVVAQAEHAVAEEVYGETTDPVLRFLAECRLNGVEARLRRIEAAAGRLRR